MLQAYADAYNFGDPDALWRVWPSADTKTRDKIEASFLSASSITMKLQLADPEIGAGSASATVTGQYSQEYTSRDGNRQKSTGSITFRLNKNDGVWVITAVS